MWPFNSLKSLRTQRTETGARYYVRSAAAADVEDIIDVKLQVWEQAYRKLMPHEFFVQAAQSVEEQTQFWKRRTLRTAKTDPRLFLAEDLTGKIVGLATVELPRHDTLERLRLVGHTHPEQARRADHESDPPVIEARWIEIRNIYVLAQAHGTGVAQALLHRATARTVAEVRQDLADAPTVIARVPSELARAQRFFLKAGFQPVGEAYTVSEGPWEGLEEHLMVRWGSEQH